ncbi:NAD(P)-dependent oxidoreductase [Wenyingzhuangia sp. 2_MG-2023]|uniref:NAD(P)-dependent oxidoreductase n=1 Tax=Wenyingzhuangia sp. 2_MG-2023 TaxID=3062639 RepID=UPI0026E14D2E|nr:NAD(P)H-binding protein [Wenyingzhuangia sp. 2_MG-2023]MDO6736779.1 NAD(P)H-binding protein [Wenyingzhuangia sp. 2_MG-2023]
MKITIVGAGGNIGQRIVKEAASRNYSLKLITSKSKDFFGTENAELQAVDIFNTDALAESFKGSDVVISAYAPPHSDTSKLMEASKSLVAAAKKANVRLIAVGGAGSLKVSETLQLVDAPNFPEEYKPVALAHRGVLEQIYNKERELNWTNVSPSAYIFEGERTNNFKIGEDNLIVNDKGESSISMEDFAVGIINEVEEAKFSKKRFTIGY